MTGPTPAGYIPAIFALVTAARNNTRDNERAQAYTSQALDLLRLLLDEPVPGPTEPGRGTPPAPPKPWDDAVIEAMHVWGGGFVKALADAYLRADGDNRRRILEVWDPLYGPQYREQAKRLRQREQDDEETLAVPAGGAR